MNNETKFGNQPELASAAKNDDKRSGVEKLSAIILERKPTLAEWVEAGLAEEAYFRTFPSLEGMATGVMRQSFQFVPTRKQWIAGGRTAEEYDEIYGLDAVPTVPEPSEAPVTAAPGAASKRPTRYIVDEIRDRVVAVGASTLIFRPGQLLQGRLLDIARYENVTIREA